jgi:hypothetical protein
MIESILWITLILGWFVLAPWYALRILATELGRIDDKCYFLAFGISLFVGWAWPLILAGRLVYIGCVRYVPPIPALKIKPIEKPTTYRERKALKAAEDEEMSEQFKKWVQERELA